MKKIYANDFKKHLFEEKLKLFYPNFNNEKIIYISNSINEIIVNEIVNYFLLEESYLRIQNINKKRRIQTLAELKVENNLIDDFKRMQNNPGITLICGATGSGKTTLLSSLLQNTVENKKIILCSDFVEKDFINKNGNEYIQKEINFHIDENPSGDILSIDEIYNPSNCKTILKAFKGGFSYCSTFYAQDIPSVIKRIIDLNTEENDDYVKNILLNLNMIILIKRLDGLNFIRKYLVINEDIKHFIKNNSINSIYNNIETIIVD